ncbi:MAG: hypothetical protein RR521_08410 [Clostridia bacterium]
MNRQNRLLAHGGRQRDEEKDALDTRTSYLTLLPPMNEGFHIGYQATPGILNDENRRPREWLENVAKYMCAPGKDVGYAIPDVLASEQQLRRLARLPHEAAMRHQEMLDYRAILAMLLLWDGWEKDDTWPTLGMERLGEEETGFCASVRAALSPQRAGEGLRVMTLTPRRADGAEPRPLCLLSNAMVIMPAADQEDWSELLPRRITWYDRKRKRFIDPCEGMDERDRARLVAQLRLLQALNEREALHSPLYAPDARLCSLLGRFADDLLRAREGWRKRLEAGEPEAEWALRTRILAAYCLRERTQGAVTERRERLLTATLAQNPLVRELLSVNGELPDDIEQPEESYLILEGVPFARASTAWLEEPANALGEDEALARLGREIDLLDQFNREWSRKALQTLGELQAALARRVGASGKVLQLLEKWANECEERPARSDCGMTLRYPMRERPVELSRLLREMFGETGFICAEKPFSDCLLLIDGAEQAPFDDPVLAQACRLEGGEALRYAIPPLSPELCAWLQAQGELDDPAAARLQPKSLQFKLDARKQCVEASFRVQSRTRGTGTATINAVTFVRSYRLADQPEEGGAFALPACAMPYVVTWPNARLAPGLWKAYFVYTHRPDVVDVWTLRTDGWAQGTLRTASAEGETIPPMAAQGKADAVAVVEATTAAGVAGARGGLPSSLPGGASKGRQRLSVGRAAGGTPPPEGERAWHTARTERFPAFVCLSRGTLSIGALINDCARRPIRHETTAAVGIDFGSIATTVMLRQGDKVQPALLPDCMHCALLAPMAEDERFLPDELLPKTALMPEESGGRIMFYSVMDMFTDDPAAWRGPLQDGHIYYRESLSALLRKNENTLYYDLKWGEEEYVLRCMRLFLKQVMLQASLAARLWGSPSLSWRVSMPNALPLHRQEAFLEMMRGLSREVAQEVGMPLTQGFPSVLYATENQADGLYFRSRNEVNARAGYLNMDIGGGTTDLSLWLNNARYATVESSLLLGCRQMLYDSISAWHVADFEQDFADAPARLRGPALEVARVLRAGASTTRGRQKGMFLLDDLFAKRAAEIRATLTQTRAEGRISYVESLLLFNVGFLFYVCGELLRRAYEDEELRALLPRRMELCVAGNGGQFLKAFDDEQRGKLCQLAIGCLPITHPTRTLLLVQSRQPKQEVAIGLLSEDDSLQSTLQSVDRWNGTFAEDVGRARENPMTVFLPLFYRGFPQAAKRLMPAAFEGDGERGGARLSANAAMEVDTIFENERFKTPEDDLAMAARCFWGLKRLWRV